MNKTRLEAFSDGVIAILITIMILELKAPHDTAPAALMPLLPAFLSYVLSFIYLAIYWNNHHHMFQAASKVTGGMLWANMHLLFWLSLIPFTTAWMGENHFEAVPVAIYGVVLLFSALAYWTLQSVIIRTHGPGSILGQAVGRDLKGKLSPVLYLVAIFFAFAEPWVSKSIYVVVAMMWLVPDRRIEKLFRG